MVKNFVGGFVLGVIGFVVVVAFLFFGAGCARQSWEQQIIGSWRMNDDKPSTTTFLADKTCIIQPANGAFALQGHWEVVDHDKQTLRMWTDITPKENSPVQHVSIEGDTITLTSEKDGKALTGTRLSSGQT